MPKLNQEKKRIIIEVIDNKVLEIFEETFAITKTKSGDITPEQVEELEDLKLKFEHLLFNVIENNH